MEDSHQSSASEVAVPPPSFQARGRRQSTVPGVTGPAGPTGRRQSIAPPAMSNPSGRRQSVAVGTLEHRSERETTVTVETRKVDFYISEKETH